MLHLCCVLPEASRENLRPFDESPARVVACDLTQTVTAPSMSFRRFVYYCAVCGAWFALLGWTAGSLASWASGTLLGSEDPTQTSILLHASVLGLCLGVFVALGLSGLDALWNLPLRQIGQMLLRVLTAVIVGGLGGLFGGF